MKQENVWGSIRVPQKFKESIENFINRHPELGYRSVREFITSAVREKMQELQKREMKM